MVYLSGVVQLKNSWKNELVNDINVHEDVS
jgi:hypothetical protein